MHPVDSPRRRRTSTVGDFDRARHSIFSRLLVLFVTTGLLGCAAPVSDSTDLPAGDESIDPFENLDGKADQAGSRIELLPIRLVADEPDILGSVEPSEVNMNWERGSMEIEFPSNCLPLDVVTTGPPDPAPHSGVEIFVTTPAYCPPRTSRKRSMYFDLRPLLHKGVGAITLPNRDITYIWRVPSWARNFWRSSWTHPLSCWSSGDASGNVYPNPNGATADLRPWDGPRDAVFQLHSRSNHELSLVTTNDAHGAMVLERGSVDLFSGTIAWNENVHEVTCVELRSP